MPIDVFFDANIVVYLFGQEASKADRSEALIAAGGVVSVQILNEVALLARRKMHKSWPEVHQVLTAVRANCGVVPNTLAIHERGLAYAERYQLRIYDSMIVAAAVLTGCATLYSEDMHDGQVIDGLTIRNPYAEAG